MPLEQALADAYAQRARLPRGQGPARGGRSRQRGRRRRLLPSLRLDADYGTIGQTVSDAHPTYAVAATVRVPIFEGGRTQGKPHRGRRRWSSSGGPSSTTCAAASTWRCATALLDLTAAAQQLEAAQTHRGSLAGQQLAQARDRFAAGVAGNIEVTQAQEAVAAASDQYIDALYRHNLAKASLARAVGSAEQAVTAFLGGTK